LGGAKETDLIYEGIATCSCVLPIFQRICHKETDLIYEGIATHLLPPDQNHQRRPKKLT